MIETTDGRKRSAADTRTAPRAARRRSAAPASIGACPATAARAASDVTTTDDRRSAWPARGRTGPGPTRRRSGAGSALAGAVLALGLPAAACTVPDLPAVAPPAMTRPAPIELPAPPAAGRTPGRPVMGGPGWRVIDARSVTGVLLVTVETERLADLMAIARTVVAPAAASHLEALVYFRRPSDGRAAAARVQWTPRDGYVALSWTP